MVARRALPSALALALALGAAGCGGGGRAASDALRPAAGYASYEGCGSTRGRCSGAAPAALRRALHLPRASAGCPISPTPAGSFAGPLAGSGPVHPVLTPAALIFDAPPTRTFDGSAWGGTKLLWIGAAAYRGPVLIRGRQLDGPHPVGFGPARVPFAEMQLLASGALSPEAPAGWREWPSYTRLRTGGCYAFQVDGTSFSSVIVFRAVALARLTGLSTGARPGTRRTGRSRRD